MASRADDALRTRFDGILQSELPGAARLDALEAMILCAAEAGDGPLEFLARTHWIRASAQQPRPPELRIANLTWCLHWMDEHPADVDRAGQVACLRDSARRIEQIALDPSVSVGEIRRLLHTYRQLRIRGGFTEHGEHALRLRVAAALSDGAEAAYQWALRLESSPDDLAPCAGCSAGDEVLLLVRSERWHRAVSVACAYAASDEPSCGDHPFSTQAAVLPALTLTGRHEEALRMAADAWSDLMVSPDNPAAAGRIIQWRTWSGDPVGAARLVEEYLPHLDNERGRVPGWRQIFTTAAATTMRHLCDQGLGSTEIAGASAAEQRLRWAEESRERARLFDARNRSSAATRWFERRFWARPWNGGVVGPDAAFPATGSLRRAPLSSRAARPHLEGPLPRAGTTNQPSRAACRHELGASETMEASIADVLAPTRSRGLRTMRWWRGLS